MIAKTKVRVTLSKINWTLHFSTVLNWNVSERNIEPVFKVNFSTRDGEKIGFHSLNHQTELAFASYENKKKELLTYFMSQFTKTIFLHIKINQFFPEVKGFHSQDSHKNLNFKSKYKLLREVDIIYICLTKLARKFFQWSIF